MSRGLNRRELIADADRTSGGYGPSERPGEALPARPAPARYQLTRCHGMTANRLDSYGWRRTPGMPNVDRSVEQ